MTEDCACDHVHTSGGLCLPCERMYFIGCWVTTYLFFGGIWKRYLSKALALNISLYCCPDTAPSLIESAPSFFWILEMCPRCFAGVYPARSSILW